jgi:predicted RNA-binding protein YlxR (DUF448 family)
MIRVVRTPTGVVIDPTGKKAGRGAYLHDRVACWENGLKGALAAALKTQISPEDHKDLLAYIRNLSKNELEEPLEQVGDVN